MTEGIHDITEARSKRATAREPQTQQDFEAMSNTDLAAWLEHNSNA